MTSAVVARQGAALSEISSIDQLARLLETEPGKLERLAADTTALYRTIRIPKLSGGERVLHAPRSGLKRIQKRILRRLSARLSTPPWVHGGVRRRSIITHAQPHLRKAMVATMDVTDFFGSTHREHVAQVLTTAGVLDSARECLLALVTLSDVLPQGAPTSTLIANHAFADADTRIRRLCRRHDIGYTRYVDDMAFSASSSIEYLRGPLQSAVADGGYAIAPHKTKFMPASGRQVVTGLLVNRWLRPTAEFIDGIEDHIAACQLAGPAVIAESLGLSVSELRANLLGRAQFLRQFDVGRAEYLLRRIALIPRRPM